MPLRLKVLDGAPRVGVPQTSVEHDVEGLLVLRQGRPRREDVKGLEEATFDVVEPCQHRAPGNEQVLKDLGLE